MRQLDFGCWPCESRQAADAAADNEWNRLRHATTKRKQQERRGRETKEETSTGRGTQNNWHTNIGGVKCFESHQIAVLAARNEMTRHDRLQRMKYRFSYDQATLTGIIHLLLTHWSSFVWLRAKVTSESSYGAHKFYPKEL